MTEVNQNRGSHDRAIVAPQPNMATSGSTSGPEQVTWSPTKLLTVKQCAALAEENPRTMLRWLTALHKRHGETLLQHYTEPGRKVRKWRVHPMTLSMVLERTENLEKGLARLQERLSTVEAHVVALSKAHRKHRNETSKKFRKVGERLEKVDQTLEAMRKVELAHKELFDAILR